MDDVWRNRQLSGSGPPNHLQSRRILWYQHRGNVINLHCHLIPSSSVNASISSIPAHPAVFAEAAESLLVGIAPRLPG